MLSYFVAHLVFETSVCFGFQLLSLLQAYEQKEVALSVSKIYFRYGFIFRKNCAYI